MDAIETVLRLYDARGVDCRVLVLLVGESREESRKFGPHLLVAESAGALYPRSKFKWIAGSARTVVPTALFVLGHAFPAQHIALYRTVMKTKR
jgi:hypothetical protein